jgi:hydroxyethylthiazole kinase-like uncharacterized protein yjeF
VKPVVTPAEMAAIDAAAPEPAEVLIERAGSAVARVALRLLGGAYGRRVVVVAGPGNNGADGRVAGRRLERAGVRVQFVDPMSPSLPPADLVIDAAFGTGLSRPYTFPLVPDGTPVLAVDIPSGVDGQSGARLGEPAPAQVTVTFAALKPGLLFGPGRTLAGVVELVDIGLDVSRSTVGLVERADVTEWLPRRSVDAHKWLHAVRVVGGSSSMTGAPRLAAAGALRFGAGYVQLAIPGRDGVDDPREAVGFALPPQGWGPVAASALDRIRALVVGPGLGATTEPDIDALLMVDRPLVLDGDALQPGLLARVSARSAATVVTPHDGEFARLGGSDTGDRLTDTRALASSLNAVVLRKGPTSVIAAPDGRVRLVANGDASLATAGTGDVLAGMVGAALAQGCEPLAAAAAAAWVHAEAGRGVRGLVASDLADRVRTVLSSD